MQLGWIDFSKQERNKVLNVLHLLDEPGAVDELGVGPIRDAFADYFFPGTSTVQTRAKYFLIVPYVLKEAGSGMYGSDLNTILRKIDNEERRCRDLLTLAGTDGVIGSLVPHSWVVRTPSKIYWNGIKKLGIFRAADLSVKEYIRQSIIQRTLKLAKTYGNRDKEAEENEKDDADAGDLTSFQFWSLGDTYQKDWRDNLTIELLPKEAAYLKNQIITSQRESLFAFILKKNISPEKYDSFGALSAGLKGMVSPDLEHMMKLADDFNNLVAMMMTRYNVIVSQGRNKSAADYWNTFSQDMKRRSKVELKDIFNELNIKNINLFTFLKLVQEAFAVGDIGKADELIMNREVKIKGQARAKTKRAGEYPEESWIGYFMLDYRYGPAKRIIKDIVKAEVKEHV